MLSKEICKKCRSGWGDIDEDQWYKDRVYCWDRRYNHPMWWPKSHAFEVCSRKLEQGIAAALENRRGD